MLSLISVKTHRMNVPQDDLFAVLAESLPPLEEGDVVCVTTKVVSIHQGRCVPVEGANLFEQKDALIQQEADVALDRTCSKYNVCLTLKNYALMPAAGIDESNADGHFILLPDKPFEFAKELWQWLREKYEVEKLGVILTDSHTIPMRWGTVGISMGFWGLEPLRDYRGTDDLYGRDLEFSQTNHVDGLAAAAVALMGEGNESTPVVIVRNWPGLVFTDKDPSTDFFIEPEDDLYQPLLEIFGKK